MGDSTQQGGGEVLEASGAHFHPSEIDEIPWYRPLPPGFPAYFKATAVFWKSSSSSVGHVKSTIRSSVLDMDDLGHLLIAQGFMGMLSTYLVSEI